MRNFVLTLSAVVLSVFLAYPFGYLTRHQFPIDFAGYIFGEGTIYFFDGLFFANLFVTPIIFHVFSKRRSWTGAMVASVPAIVVSVLVGSSYVVWAGIFFLVGIILAGLLGFVADKITVAR